MTQDNNDAPVIAAQDPLVALSLLSRLPLPAIDSPRAAEAAWAYPLVGVILGALAALVGALAHGLGLPAALCALLALTTLIMLSGAMHEDGLADTADGFWGGWDRATRLEIMRDSRIGTYGVLALALSLAARWAALWLLYETGLDVATAALIGAAAVSRAAMPVVMATLPHARRDGLSHHVGQVGRPTALIAVALGGLAGLLVLGWMVVWPALWAAVVVLGLCAVARRKIGGQSGDILGACQQLAEIAMLFALLA